jgi:MFS family permease
MLGGIGVMIIAQLFGLSYGSVPAFWRYVVSVVLMYAIGYPIGHTAVLGAFSKIQKSGPQAAMLGWFATSGSLSRIIFPIISGYLDKAVDNSPFNIVLFMLTLAYFGIVLLKPQMRIYIEVPDANARKVPQEDDEDGETHTGLWGCIHASDKLWKSFSRTEKAEALVMVFLLFFTLFDLVVLSGGLRKKHGFDTYEDQGFDID